AVGEGEEEAGGDRAGLSGEFLVDIIEEDAQKAYDRREEELTPEVMRELERRVVLAVLDRKWREHLYEMDYLREGIGLRAMAQRDPLVEYQREGYDMFNVMMDAIKEESVGNLFNLEVQVQENPIVEEAQDTVESAQDAVPGMLFGPRSQAAGQGAVPAGQVPGGVAPDAIPGGAVQDSPASAGEAAPAAFGGSATAAGRHAGSQAGTG